MFASQEFSQKTRLECMFSVRLLSAVQDLAVAKVASAYSLCLILVNHCNGI